MPAPYMARIFWVAAERWEVLRNAEWESELRAAHALTLAKLPKGVLAVLEMPERERAKVIAERRKVLAGKAEAAARAKAAGRGKAVAEKSLGERGVAEKGQVRTVGKKAGRVRNLGRAKKSEGGAEHPPTERRT